MTWQASPWYFCGGPPWCWSWWGRPWRWWSRCRCPWCRWSACLWTPAVINQSFYSFMKTFFAVRTGTAAGWCEVEISMFTHNGGGAVSSVHSLGLLAVGRIRSIWMNCVGDKQSGEEDLTDKTRTVWIFVCTRLIVSTSLDTCDGHSRLDLLSLRVCSVETGHHWECRSGLWYHARSPVFGVECRLGQSVVPTILCSWLIELHLWTPR